MTEGISKAGESHLGATQHLEAELGQDVAPPLVDVGHLAQEHAARCQQLLPLLLRQRQLLLRPAVPCSARRGTI